MSGRKRVTIDESEWIRLKKEAGQLKRIQRDMPSLIESVRRQTQADLERVSEELENRQTAVEQRMADLSEHTRKLEADTNRRLRDQARRFESTLAETAGTLRAETADALAEHRHQVRTELAQLRRQSQEDIRRLSTQVGDLVEQGERAAETAHIWIGDARTMRSAIADTLPHERHAPGRLAALERRLVTAEQNVAEGNAGPAIALAQEAYHGLSELRVDVELAEEERLFAELTASAALDQVRELIDHNAIRPVEDDDGAPIPDVTLDVDHWSSGGITALRADVVASLQVVRDEDASLSTKELVDVAQSVVPAYEVRLAELIERAAVRQLGSQLRINVADVVVRSLHDVGGYELVDSTYAAGDQREAFAAKLKAYNGNEIVVDVAPSADDSGRFVLRVLSYDYDTTAEPELRDRTRVIHADLRGQGINAAEPEEERGVPDAALLDFDAMRRPRPLPLPRGAPE